MYKNIKISNWKADKHYEFSTITEMVNYFAWDLENRIHIYPVLRGERLVHNQYCLTSELKRKPVRVTTNTGKTKLVKNWMKFCEAHSLMKCKFKKVLDGDNLHYKGFCLEENKEKIPKKFIRETIYTNGPKIIKANNARDFAEKSGLTWEAARKIECGKTMESRNGWKVKEVKYREVPLFSRK